MGGLTGLSSENFADNTSQDYDSGVSFAVCLGIFYPCFTGILSGANRSKNLKSPSKDIPKGTFAAIIASLIMYSSFMILWGGVAEREYLKGNDTNRRRLAGGGDGG
jgi:amino acid transporter